MIAFVVIISFVNIPVTGGVTLSKLLHINPYWQLHNYRAEVFESARKVSSWARLNTPSNSLFMFLVDEEAEFDKFAYMKLPVYFKTRAVRSISPYPMEFAEFIPIKQIPRLVEEYDLLIAAIKDNDLKYISHAANSYKADYLVCTPLTKDICSSITAGTLQDFNHLLIYKY